MRYAELNLQVPAGWEDLTQVVLRAAAVEHGFKANLIVTRDTPATPEESTAEYCARTAVRLAETLAKYEPLADKAATFGKNSGHLLEHRFEANGVALWQQQLVVSRDKKLVVLTFTHAAAAATARKLAEQAFGAFSFA